MTYTVEINPKAWKKQFSDGVKASFSTGPRAFFTLLSGLSIFLLSILLSNPSYSIEMFSAGMQYWTIAVQTRFYGVLAMTGYTGLFLTVAFSLLAGVTFTNTGVRVRRKSFDGGVLGTIPGLAAAGCASCGVGVLSLFGLGAVLATLPFEGNLLRLGAVLLLVALIVRAGSPDICKLS